MLGTQAATWSIAAIATFGVIVRPWNVPEFFWAVAGAILLVMFSLLPWHDPIARLHHALRDERPACLLAAQRRVAGAEKVDAEHQDDEPQHFGLAPPWPAAGCVFVPVCGIVDAHHPWFAPKKVGAGTGSVVKTVV